MLKLHLSDEAGPVGPMPDLAPGPIPDGPLFEDLFMPRRLPLRSVIVSAAAHVTVGYLVVAYTAYVVAHPLQKPPDLNTARILELNIDNLQPYIPRPPVEKPKPAPRPAPARRVTHSERPQVEDPAPANPIPAPKVVRKFVPAPLQVADAPKVARAPETLIQLDIPKPELQTQLQVPNALILTNSPVRKLPRPFIRPPELPKKEIPAQVVVEMDLPKIQDSAGNMAVAQILTDHTALPVLPTSKAPVSGVAPKAAEVAKGNWKSEEAPALVALPDNPIPDHTAVVVPPAVQMGSKGNDNTQAGPAAQGGGGGTGTSAAQTAQTAANINPKPATGNPSAGAGTAPAATPAPDSRSTGTSPTPAAALAGVYEIHLPHNGNYEVVVTQTSGIVPGSADFLRGRPVYSVYLKAGARKDWILQYCLPSDSDGPRRNSTIVVLGNPAPIAAPYAYTMLRPALNFAAPDIRYAMIHGMINKDGKFEQLKEVGDRALKNMPELMQALSGWEFRPATKDGAPVAVEILLAIPNPNRS